MLLCVGVIDPVVGTLASFLVIDSLHCFDDAPRHEHAITRIDLESDPLSSTELW
jgi:hypothetical protein